jgi:hypothetical protein
VSSVPPPARALIIPAIIVVRKIRKYWPIVKMTKSPFYSSDVEGCKKAWLQLLLKPNCIVSSLCMDYRIGIL